MKESFRTKKTTSANIISFSRQWPTGEDRPLVFSVDRVLDLPPSIPKIRGETVTGWRGCRILFSVANTFGGRRLRYVDDDTVTKPSRRARKPQPGDNSVSFSQIGISDIIIFQSGHRAASHSFDYLFSSARLSFCNSYFKSLPTF